MRLLSTVSATLLALASASVLAQAASAPAATPGVDKRQANQEQRIEQGVNSGQLNARETLRLEREQKRVAVAEQKAKADGTVTAGERKKLHHLQNKASRDIRREKHDAQTAAGKP